MVGKCNIVQAEFFHVGDVRSFDELFGEIGDRLRDGMPLKTVVRFVDEDGLLTHFAQRVSAHKLRKEEIRDEVLRLRGLRRWFQSLHFHRFSRKYFKLKSTGHLLATDQLALALNNPYSVAVERKDHSFRRIRKSEIHDALEAARAAKNVWLFVFEPNDLLADSNKLVAQVM